MAINYDRMRATAARLISENGAPCLLRVMTPGVFDPITNKTVGGGFVPHSVRAVISRLNEGVDDFDVQALRGEFVIGEARKITIPAELVPQGAEPAPGDRVEFAPDDVWHIRGVNPIEPDNTPIVFSCVVTR